MPEPERSCDTGLYRRLWIKSLVPREDDDDVEIEEEQWVVEPKVAEEPQRRRIEWAGSGNDRCTINDTSVSSTDVADSEDWRSIRRRRRRNTKITFSFKVVDDTIRPFDGGDCYPVEKWILDFEKLAVMFEWNDVQKLVFGRKFLKVFLCVD